MKVREKLKMKSTLSVSQRTLVRCLMSAIALAPFAAWSEDAAVPEDRASAEIDATTTVSGKIRRLLTNPEGDVDGLLLNDGRQVHFPPHLSARVTATVKAGDDVQLVGHEESKEVFRAKTITNSADKKSVVDEGPGAGPIPGKHPAPLGGPGHPKPPGRPRNAGMKEMDAKGKIEVLLKGPAGDTNGVILADGTLIHFPPKLLEQAAKKLEKGKSVSVSGYGTANSYGKSIEASELK